MTTGKQAKLQETDFLWHHFLSVCQIWCWLTDAVMAIIDMAGNNAIHISMTEYSFECHISMCVHKYPFALWWLYIFSIKLPTVPHLRNAGNELLKYVCMYMRTNYMITFTERYWSICLDRQLNHDEEIIDPTMHWMDVPQCTVLWRRCAHSHTSLLRDGALWVVGLVHCGICAMSPLKSCGFVWEGSYVPVR